MWTISDFSAYSMLSGWSTHGRLACPYCMENSQAFQLKNGGSCGGYERKPERLSPTADRVVDESTLYFESVGGFNKKSRISGLGDGCVFYLSQHSSSSASCTSGLDASSILQIPRMESQMERMEEAIRGIIDARQEDRGHDEQRFHDNESKLEAVLGEVRELKSEMASIRREMSRILEVLNRK